MAEARFLASRESRQEGLKSRKKRHESLHIFWSSLKAYLQDWDQKIEALAGTTVEDEDDKRSVSLELNRLKDDLLQLKSYCLSDSSTALFLESRGDDAKKIVSRWRSVVPVLDQELPQTDLRLLHEEFSVRQDQLDRVRAKLLPKGKFVFRKYREALKRQQEEASGDSQVGGGRSLGSSTSSPLSSSGASQENQGELEANLKTSRSSMPRCSLEALSSVRVALDAQGRAYQLDDPSQSNATTEEPFHSLDVVDGESTLILRNIRDSTIELQGSYQALYLVGVTQSHVHVVGSVQGAIHVTDCRHTTCRIHSCQQVRLHDSSYLRLRVGTVKGGAILEACHRVIFVAPSVAASNALDIRDFGFLKRGIPSPNYTVEVEPESESTDSQQIPAAESDASATTVNAEKFSLMSMKAESEVQQTSGRSSDDDDDEEEL